MGLCYNLEIQTNSEVRIKYMECCEVKTFSFPVEKK